MVSQGRDTDDPEQDTGDRRPGRLIQGFVPEGSCDMKAQRPERGEALRELAERVRARLVLAVPAAVKAAGVRERCYCLVLSHGETLFPLTLILGTEAERRAILAARGPAGRTYLYSPSVLAVLLDDPAGERDRALLDEGIARANAWDLGRQTLWQVARELGERDWSGVLDVTDDFVALALDYEADELAESLAACASPERLALLRARGFA